MTIFSNMTYFVAIVVSSLAKIFGYENPFLKVGFLDMHSAKTLVIVIGLKGVKYKFSEFIVCSEDSPPIL